MNYFEVFGLPKSLILDTAELEKSFHDLSRAFHPDRHATGSVEERRQALRMTTLLNDAYRTLRHPIRRAEYLVAIEGFKPDGSKVPRDFLMEVFDINERLDELKAHKRSPAGAKPAEVDVLRAEIRGKSEVFDSRIATSAREWDRLVAADAPEAEKKGHLAALTELLSEFAYIRNLERDVEENF